MTRSEEAPSGRNKWRHQCGRTTAVLATEAQQVGESQLQSGAFTDRRHMDVSDKCNAAMEGEFATVTIH